MGDVPGLVIFDCDGVLVDTETLANTHLAKMLAERGLNETMESSRHRFMGRPMTEVAEIVREEDGLDIGDDFVDRWQASLPEVFAGGVDAIAHVKTVLERLAAEGIPFCVASSGTLAKMTITLGSAGLLPLVENVRFSTTMVKRGKPAPDLFLHAAREMGVAPEHCVVIEDSKFGVMGAIAAGMRAFGYAGDPHTDKDALAANGATVFDDMRDLPGLLGLDG